MGSERRAQVDDATIARLRLQALGLPVTPQGWVPEPPADSEAVAAPATAPEATAVAAETPTMDSLARGWIQDRTPPWAHGIVEHLRLRTVAGVVGLLVALVIGVVLLLHHQSSGSYPTAYDESAATGPASAASSSPASVASTGASAAASIVVDVGGRVRKPGLVTLPAGSRVADALAAAGGPLRQHEIATLNLAARVTDGELLLVGVKDTAAGAAPGSTDPGAGSEASPAPVDLNAATIDQLETLPGVGPATAQKIIEWRTANNGFTSVSQLQQVPGIGPVKFGELSPLVTL